MGNIDYKWEILLHLYGKEEVPVSRLGTKLKLEKQSMLNLVMDLHNKGLVEYSNNNTYIFLTKKGIICHNSIQEYRKVFPNTCI